jgi:hypothetical protein
LANDKSLAMSLSIATTLLLFILGAVLFFTSKYGIYTIKMQKKEISFILIRHIGHQVPQHILQGTLMQDLLIRIREILLMFLKR